MSYKPESEEEKRNSHECPQMCVRLIRTLYVDCEEQALPPEALEPLRLCSFDKHRFNFLTMQVDKKAVERCIVCGCWRF